MKNGLGKSVYGNNEAFSNGQKAVTTAGTQVVLGTTSGFSGVTIKALRANTGFIYVGDANVSSTTGFELDAGEEITLHVNRLDEVWIDSSVNAEGVSFVTF